MASAMTDLVCEHIQRSASALAKILDQHDQISTLVPLAAETTAIAIACRQEIYGDAERR